MNSIKKFCFLLLTITFILMIHFSNKLNQRIMPEKEEKKENFPMTLISAFFDISRVGRPNEDYFKWIKETIKLNAPFIFYTQAKHKKQIESIFESNGRTNYKIITIELEELEYYKDIQAVQNILSSKDFIKKIAYPDRIECTNPLYNIVQFSKLTLLLKAARLNPFNSAKFIWVVAGISRFFPSDGRFDLNRKLTGKLLTSNLFYVPFEKERAFDDQEFQNKNDSIIWSAKNFIRGTIMGGTLGAIQNVSVELRKKWTQLLEKQIVNNEQMVLMLVYFDKPSLFGFKEILNVDYIISLINERD